MSAGGGARAPRQRRGRGSERGGGRAQGRGDGLGRSQGWLAGRGGARGARARSVTLLLGGAGGRTVMAATFFGEVVKAPCRAGTEDEEEEDEGKTETPEDREVRRQLARKR